MKSYNQFILDTALGGSLAREICRMEEARQVWAQKLQFADTAVDRLRDLAYPHSLADQITNQWQEMERQRYDSLRKMLDPIADIHKSMMMDSGVKRMLEDLASPKFASDDLARIANETSGCSAIKAMQESMQSSIAHAQQTFAASSISSVFNQAMKAYEGSRKHWAVPPELVSSVGALKAMQDQIGRLTLPVIDWSAAATLAKVLGPEGIEAQLAALGIGPDGTVSEDSLRREEQGIGLSRKTLELMALLSFIFAVLVPIYQEISSREWQHQTDKNSENHRLMLEAQSKRLEALSKLVEKAFILESKRADARFVVLDRVAIVRDEPKHGATMMGKLLPREMVKPIAEQGMWIQFEYYHWLRQEYQTGWALKKYFKRIAASCNQYKPLEK